MNRDVVFHHALMKIADLSWNVLHAGNHVFYGVLRVSSGSLTPSFPHLDNVVKWMTMLQDRLQEYATDHTNCDFLSPHSNFNLMVSTKTLGGGRLEAIALRLEAIATRLEAIACRLDGGHRY